MASYDERSASAEVANDVWDHAVRLALTAHDWPFARRVEELARRNMTPKLSYQYVYQQPSDFLRRGRISDSSSHFDGQPEFACYQLTEHGYETDAETIFLEYIYDRPAEAVWPPFFVDYFVALLAAKITSPLKSARAKQGLEQLADARLASARSQSSSQQPRQRIPMGRWASARRG